MNRKEQLEEMLKEDPKDPFLIYAIALEIAKEGNIKEAASRLERLLEEQPDYLGAYYQLGQFYEKENEEDKAKAVYERGMLLAREKGNNKTEGEIRSALDLLD